MAIPSVRFDFTYCKGEGKGKDGKFYKCQLASTCQRVAKYQQDKDLFDTEPDSIISMASPFYCNQFGFSAYLHKTNVI